MNNTSFIKSFKKHIPRKPFIWGDGYYEGHIVYDSWDCPLCKTTYELYYDEYKYCPNCGQKIDWSDYPIV